MPTVKAQQHVSLHGGRPRVLRLALINLARYEETRRWGCKHPEGVRWKKAGVEYLSAVELSDAIDGGKVKLRGNKAEIVRVFNMLDKFAPHRELQRASSRGVAWGG